MRSLMFLVISYGILNTSTAQEKYLQKSTLSRKKRYLELPEGTSFVSTLQLLKAIQINEPSPINLALEFDVIWKIPNESKLLVKRLARLRRHRRELYANFELALNSQKLPGKMCILRSICQAKFILSPKGLSFVEDVLRVILSYPQDPRSETDDYDIAHRNGNCDVTYPCPISLLDLLLSYNRDHE